MAGPSNPCTILASIDGDDFNKRLGFGASDVNNIKAAIGTLMNYLPKTQAVAVDSAGSQTYTPTYTHATPIAVAFHAKDLTAHAMLSASCVPAILTATGITVTTGQGSADGSALMTVFYT